MPLHSTYSGRYPAVRLRRLRQSDWLRRMVAESHLGASDFIWPLFVAAPGEVGAVKSMPGVYRHDLDGILRLCETALAASIPCIALFPHVPDELKSADCREAVNPDNLVCRAVRAVKQRFPELGVMCDVALDPFNADGHDGLLRDGEILNDETVEVLVQQGLVQAEAGSDLLGPSDMMDGRIGALRSALDEAGHSQVAVMAYAAKFASAFYGPFREAVGSSSALKGDKKTYQLNPANRAEALREVALDVAEGADMVMVKPGLPYLDVLREVKDSFGLPTLAYQVSGEYAMLKAASQRGWLDHDRVVLESLMCFKRAGADAILTYAALEAAQLLATQS